MSGTVARFLLGILLIPGCSTALQKSSKSNLPIQHIALNVGEGENKIVFLNYKISLADSLTEVYSFTLVSSKITDGTLKKTQQTEKKPFDPTYLYVQLNEKEAGDQYLKVHDPIKLRLEYPGENSSLAKRTFTNTVGEITIRFPYSKSLKTISIFKVQPDTSDLKKVYHASL